MTGVTYQAKTFDEFKDCIKWMRENGLLNGHRNRSEVESVVQQPKGSFEEKYKKMTGDARMRLTKDEIAKGMSREEAAKNRLDAMEKDLKEFETSPTLPTDDGEDVLG